MDTGKGNFEIVQELSKAAKDALEAKHPSHGGWFREGEIIELRDSLFRVKAVKPTQIILKLLPKIKQGKT
jgi:hypothetical protein